MEKMAARAAIVVDFPSPVSISNKIFLLELYRKSRRAIN